MVEQSLPPRVSALAAHYSPIVNADAGVTLAEVPGLVLWQLALWPDSLQGVASSIACGFGIGSVPAFGEVQTKESVAMLRIEPLKFWVIGASLTDIDATQGAVLDLSHSRTHVRLNGQYAKKVLNSFLPLDLREKSFPVNSIASSAFHHVGVTLWRSEHGYELFIPRGFAVSIYELLCDTADQYGLTMA